MKWLHWLHANLVNRAISRGTDFPCSFYSPDLTFLDANIWGMLKEAIFRENPVATIGELRENINVHIKRFYDINYICFEYFRPSIFCLNALFIFCLLLTQHNFFLKKFISIASNPLFINLFGTQTTLELALRMRLHFLQYL